MPGYTCGMEKGMHVWGALAVLVVAAASVSLYMRLPQSAPASAVAEPLPVLTSGIQLEVAQKRPPLPAQQQAALDALAASDPGLVARADPMQMVHAGAIKELPLSFAEQAEFEGQLALATGAVAGLDTPAEAAAAGYTQASRELPGIGSHWVNWALIDKPFDPARPAMLLYATLRGTQKLVGYSYFVKSDTEPKGFAGQNDMWHQHGSLCLLNGWLVGEGIEKSECPGTWLYGSKLWMMHAWVSPVFVNPWGIFGMMNPNVCPDGLECKDLKDAASMPAVDHSTHPHTH